jgi:Xaa-Pro dipeptidase
MNMLLNEERLHEVMAHENLDVLIGTSPENVTYLSGYWALSQWIRRGPQTYVIWPAPGRGEPCIVTSTSLLDQVADQEVWVKKIHRFGDFFIEHDPTVELDDLDREQMRLFELPNEGTPIDALCGVLKEYGLEGSRIGLDELGIHPFIDAELRERLNKAAFRPAYEIFRHIRAVKTPEEQRRLAIAAHIAEASISSALELVKPGVSEQELGLAFHERTVQEGGFPVLGCIGFGTRSAMINVHPSDKRLENGEIIRFDVGGRYQHYRADIARNAILGEPSRKIDAYHKALHAGIQRAYEIIRPGVLAADIYEAVMETVRREGLPHYQRTHVGHGIGLDGYDMPNLTPGGSHVIEEGMVLSIEAPYYELGFGGLQVEDMVVVRKDGLESFMETDGKLMVLP